MADLIPSSFCKYSMADLESKLAAVLSQPQKQHIQNLLADIAEAKLGLTFDVEHPLRYAQTEAEYQGQLGMLKLILALSDEAEEYLRTRE